MADPVYLPQVSNRPASYARAASNVAEARAVSDLGNQISNTSAVLLDQEISVMSQSYVTDFYGRAAAMFQDKKRGYDPTGVGFSNSFMSDFDAELDSFLKEQNVNPLIEPAIRRSINPTRRQFIDNSISYENSARGEFTKQALAKTGAQISNQALIDPDSYPDQKDRLETILSDSRAVLTPEEHSKLATSLSRSLDESTLQGVINKDPVKAMNEIEAGVWEGVDPEVLRNAYEQASEKSKDEKVSTLVAAASKDPINFYNQASRGEFSDPVLQENWDSISESEKLDIATRSISLSSMMNNYVDGQIARRDKAIKESSDDLKRMLFTTDDVQTKQELLDRITILGVESGESLDAIRGHIDDFNMEGGRDDPIVYENLVQAFVDGNYNIEPLDFVGAGLSRSTAVKLSLSAKTAREGNYSEAINLIKNSVSLHEGFGSLGASESKKEEARLVVDFLTAMEKDSTQDPMQLAVKMTESYDVDKAIASRRSTLERGVIDSIKGLEVTTSTGWGPFGTKLPVKEGVSPNEDIPRTEDGRIDTDELLNRMNFYMMEGILDREAFVDGPMRSIRELKNFNASLGNDRIPQ